MAKNAIRLSLIFSFLSCYTSLLFVLALVIGIFKMAKIARGISGDFLRRGTAQAWGRIWIRRKHHHKFTFWCGMIGKELGKNTINECGKHHHKFAFYCDMISEGLRNALNITTVRRKKILSVTPLYPLGVTALLVNKASRDGSAVALPRVPQH